MSGDAVLRVKSLQEPKTYDLDLRVGPDDTTLLHLSSGSARCSRVNGLSGLSVNLYLPSLCYLPGIDCWQFKTIISRESTWCGSLGLVEVETAA